MFKLKLNKRESDIVYEALLKYYRDIEECLCSIHKIKRNETGSIKNIDFLLAVLIKEKDEVESLHKKITDFRFKRGGY